MKKIAIIVLVVAASLIIVSGCSKQAGLDQIMSNPEMKSYLMTKMMEDQKLKVDMIDNFLTDSTWVNAFVDRLGQQTNARDIVLDKIVRQQGVGEMLLARFANEPTLKEMMKELSK